MLKNKIKYQLSEIKENKEKMLDILKALGRVYHETSDTETLVSALTEIIETQENPDKTRIAGNYNFLNSSGNQINNSKHLRLVESNKNMDLLTDLEKEENFEIKQGGENRDNSNNEDEIDTFEKVWALGGLSLSSQ